MYSLLEKLKSDGVELKEEEITYDVMLGQSPADILHSILLHDDGESKKIYQILYTGERMLDMRLIREQIGISNLVINTETYPSLSFPVARCERLTPRIGFDNTEDDVLTFFDESVLLKKELHISNSDDNPTKGAWVETSQIVKAYPKGKIISASVKGKTAGMEIDNSGEASKRKLKAIQNVISENENEIKPVLFSSTEKEIKAIIEIGDISVDSISEIIRFDFFLYGFFLEQYYRSDIENKISYPTIEEFVSFLTPELCIEKMKELMSGDSMSPGDIGFNTAGTIHKYITLLAKMIEALVAEKSQNAQKDNIQKAKICARIIGYQTVLWFSAGGPSKANLFSEQILLNPHRFFSEIQTYLCGFNQLELGSFMMEKYDFPESIKNIINNHPNPFYTGPDSDLSSLMYLARAALLSNQLNAYNEFHPVSANIHEIISKKMEVEHIVNKQIEEAEDVLAEMNRIMWRFEEA